MWSKFLLAAALAAAVVASPLGADEAATAAADPLSLYSIVLFLHVLLFVFWLGPDVGVYLWSRRVVMAELDVNERIEAASMMEMIDVMPRVAMSLMLTIGGILTEAVGLTHPWWQMAGIVLLGPVWLILVLVSYLRRGTAQGQTLARLDAYLRWLVVISVVVSVTYSWTTGRLDPAPYVGGKLLLFAALVVVSQLMRRQLQPFFAGVEQLARGEGGPAVDATMTASLARSRPLEAAMWLGLLVAAYLGVAKPGAPVEDVPTAPAPSLMR